jgi:MSHA biogenesis protein MshL
MSTVNQAMRSLAVVATILVTLGGCSGYTMRDNNVGGAMQDAFEVQPDSPTTTPAAPPAEVSAALLPQVQVQLPGIDARADVEQRFDVKVRRVRARDFFLSLVENTPYNMVVHPNVKGYITLDLKNVSVPEVLDVVRNVNGFDYKIIGNNVQVFPNTIHTRIFMVDYLAMKRTGQSLITSKTGQISTSGSSSGGGTNGENRGSSGGSGGENSSVITTTTDADFWEELKSSLEIIVGKEKGRKIAVNPQTGMVMVRAMPAEMRIVEEYLKNTQNIATRQVILEARIIEVLLSDGFQSGINWSGLATSGTDTLIAGQTGGGTIFSGSGVSDIYGNPSGTLNPADYSAIEGTTASAFGGVFSLALQTTDFTAFIELLKTQGDVQVLSSPRVSTVNNQKAVIKVGSDEFYVTNISSDTTSTTGNTSVSVELNPFFSGVALDVTPQISGKGDIVLHVHPSVSEVAEQTKTINTTQGTVSMPLAASNIRESDTIIRAANGQVVVIGGLMQNSTKDDVASVPILGDIPLLGALFRHTKKSSRKSELVILLKPTVVDIDGGTWQRELKRSSGAIRNMSDSM